MKRINLRSLLWFVSRPGTYGEYWRQLLRALAKRLGKRSESATEWCEKLAIGPEELIQKITGRPIGSIPDELDMPTNGIILYVLTEHLQATKVIETGVSKGRSSAALLKSLAQRDGKLVSTDIPSPDKWVDFGVAVPLEYRERWHVIRRPDRQALPQAISETGQIDMCYYDSDKSYSGRTFAYPLLWDALRDGGILVSDDIGDNFGFRDFCQSRGLNALIVKNSGKHVGVIVKN